MKAATRQRARSRLPALCVALLLACVAGPCLAQGAPVAELQRSEPGALMSERAFRRFEAVTALYSEARYAEALGAAESYLGSELNDYEKAMGEQLLGYILVALDRPADAVPRFERAIELDALPNAAHFNMMRSLAQLYAALEQWQKSIEMMGLYLAYQPEASGEDRIMMGQNYVQLGRYRDALSWVRGALERTGDTAPESWLQLELAIHFELGDHRAALRVLRTLVARWPDRLRYWEMMAGAHQALDEDVEALAALMAAYNGGLIDEPAKLLNLVRLNMYVELPYQAGRILDRAIETGVVEASPDNLELLLQAWTAAREFDRAAEVVDRLAALTADGDLLLRKARLMMEQNRWQAMLDAARQGLEIGNVGKPGEAWLMIGIALLELDQLRESRRAFQQAQEFDADSRRQAREWQRFVEERIQVAEMRAGR
jgi:tetratricopeptide (TPR) repeat protein